MQNNDNWCKRHNRNHTYGFMHEHWCSECEKENHGPKGTIQPTESGLIDFEIDFEKTDPDFKIIKNDINITLTRWPLWVECACETPIHKWNAATEFFQCQTCRGYNREINQQ